MSVFPRVGLTPVADGIEAQHCSKLSATCRTLPRRDEPIGCPRRRGGWMRRLLLALMLAAAPVHATPSSDFHRLLADHYQWLLRENPEQATALGVRTYDALLS